MNLNWTELQSGFSSELEKKAKKVKYPKPKPAPKQPTPAPAPTSTQKPNIPSMVGAAATGAGLGTAGIAAANYLTSGVGGQLQGLAAYLPALIGLAGAGGTAGSLPSKFPTIHVTTKNPPTILDLPSNQVGSLNSPNMGAKFIKSANVLERIVQNRIANSAIDNIFGSNIKKVEDNTAQKKLEIVSKYPELAAMLEDEQNKAYLEKLLQQ
jgi:hypothetical protein